MKPRLVALAGPLIGTSFDLTDEVISLGRESSNRISLHDALVSRRHSHLSRDGSGFKIKDLDSRNGTFVNGVPTKQRRLAEGDQIRIGESLFLYLEQDGSPPPPDQLIHLDDSALRHDSTIELRPGEALYLQPDKLLARLPANARLARSLGILLKASALINSLRRRDALQPQLLDLIMGAVPAEQGALLLRETESAEVACAVTRHRTPGRAAPLTVSRTIMRQVLEQGTALLSNDVLAGQSSEAVASLTSAQVSSLLCVPVILFGQVRGLIYLVTQDPQTRFDEDQLQLVTGIASMAAVALEYLTHLEWVEGELQRLRTEAAIEHSMVGESPRMRAVYQFIAKVAPTDATVLIRGASGTGKELVARAIHQNSPRAQRPFVAINCAALTETLLESELFGHEKGAFTGAIAQKKGKLEVADGGTLFLDEVGELAPLLQAKLLRVLQEREFERVGGTRPLKTDIRLVAATNRNLEVAIKAGQFREDLYYRLNVLSLTMPPLNKRREDIPLLASFFAAKYSQKLGRRVVGLAPETRACLLSYSWPGNVRELENAIERAVVLGSGELIRLEDLPETVLEAAPALGPAPRRYHEAIRETKKQLIQQSLEEAGGNYTEAARLLAVHPNYLHRLIRNLNLKSALPQ